MSKIRIVGVMVAAAVAPWIFYPSKASAASRQMINSVYSLVPIGEDSDPLEPEINDHDSLVDNSIFGSNGPYTFTPIAWSDALGTTPALQPVQGNSYGTQDIARLNNWLSSKTGTATTANFGQPNSQTTTLGSVILPGMTTSFPTGVASALTSGTANYTIIGLKDKFPTGQTLDFTNGYAEMDFFDPTGTGYGYFDFIDAYGHHWNIADIPNPDELGMVRDVVDLSLSPQQIPTGWTSFGDPAFDIPQVASVSFDIAMPSSQFTQVSMPFVEVGDIGAVPEPATVSILGPFSAGLLFRRQRSA